MQIFTFSILVLLKMQNKLNIKFQTPWQSLDILLFKK